MKPRGGSCVAFPKLYNQFTKSDFETSACVTKLTTNLNAAAQIEIEKSVREGYSNLKRVSGTVVS